MLLALWPLIERPVFEANGAARAGGSADLSLAETIAASGASVAGGSADVSLIEEMAGAGGAAAGGSAALALLLALAASGSARAGGSGALAMLLALAGSGAPASGGSANLAAILALAASGASSAGGSGDFGAPTIWVIAAGGGGHSGGLGALLISTFGITVVAVAVPRSTGSYQIRNARAEETVYAVSPADGGGGTVQVAPDELAWFLRAVPGSQVRDPTQAELFRITRPFVRQLAGPFRGE